MLKEVFQHINKGFSFLTELVRKQSFTRDEIEHFWRTRHEGLGEQVQADVRSPGGPLKAETAAVAVAGNPFARIDEELTYEEKKAVAKDWWRRSGSAFLNDPPIDGWNDFKSRPYKTQYDVAVRHLPGDSGIHAA
jgi:hypothetical protein